MTTFVVALVGYSAILLLLGFPVVVIARRRRRPDTAKKFVVAALVIGLILAVVSAGSAHLVARCESAGNTSCNDYGSTGLQVLAVIGFGIASWWTAVILYRD
jgi:hypothetical protein